MRPPAADACVAFLNQMRTRTGRGPGEAETSAGGPPLKLFAAVRIALMPAGEQASSTRSGY